MTSTTQPEASTAPLSELTREEQQDAARQEALAYYGPVRGKPVRRKVAA